MPKEPEKPTPKPAEKKRSSPTPSPETEALRAIRELRKLKERSDAALRTYQTVRNECLKASVGIENALSAEAKELVAIIRVKDGEKSEAMNGGNDAAE